MSNKQIFINQEEISYYLKDIRKKTVLTPKREKVLAKIMLSPTMTPQQKADVEKEILEGNLRFVISIAKDYQGQGVDMADLIAEGNYAVWWVKQSILQCLNENARTIRLPVNIIQELYREKKKTDKGLNELTGKLAMLPTTTRYDKPINEEGDRLVDILEDTSTIAPDKFISDEDDLKNELSILMRCLDAREREIIERYHGLKYTPHTLQEIGDVFNLTKERVRQIKEKALRKLRNDSYSLLDYLTE